MESDRVGQGAFEAPVVRDHEELGLAARYDHGRYTRSGVVDDDVPVGEVQACEVVAQQQDLGVVHLSLAIGSIQMRMEDESDLLGLFYDRYSG